LSTTLCNTISATSEQNHAAVVLDGKIDFLMKAYLSCAGEFAQLQLKSKIHQE
jgi:hypothetical protein